MLAVYGEIILLSFRILTTFVSLNSRRSIDNRFLDDFTSFSLEALATSVPSTQPPQTCRMDLESMVYNVPEVRDPAMLRRYYHLIFDLPRYIRACQRRQPCELREQPFRQQVKARWE